MPKEIPGIGLVYTSGEIAGLLGVSLFTVGRAFRDGRLPGRRFGRSVLFTVDSLKGFLEGRPAPRRSEPVAAGKPPSMAEAKALSETHAIETAMKRAGNNRGEAARLLKWHRGTLQRKLKELGLTFPRGKRGG